MDPTPPPTKIDELPDYYLGRLIAYEPNSNDRCKWVVYDGVSKVRCYTRRSAVDYINSIIMETTNEQSMYLGRARYFIIKTIESLDAASRYAIGADKLLLERLAVKLRPYLVDIDNNLRPLIHKNEELSNHQNERSDQD